MLYKHLILALLAATVAVARPQDVDALDEEVLQLPDEIIEGDGPEFDPSATCDPAAPTCSSGEWCKPNNGASKGNCHKICQGQDRAAETGECPVSPVHLGPAGCKNGQCTYSTCDATHPCTGGATCTADAVTGVKTCVAPSGCTGSGATDSCPSGKYCSSGTCTNGCKVVSHVASSTDCPTDPTHLGPAYCDATHHCVYSTCDATHPCTGGATCTANAVTGVKTCVTAPTTTKCNAYKKCPTGQYCHHKECKPGCDKKWSKCKTTTITKGICDGKHSCFKVEDKKTGASCRKDKDCSNGYKCVRDHGHDSHCHKAVGDKAACNQKDVLFPDVCNKGFECKRQADKSYKCVKEEHKQHDKYKH